MIEKFFARYCSGKGKFYTILEIGRPWNGIIIGLIAIMGYVLMTPTLTNLGSGIILFLSFLFIYMGCCILNDICDKHVDDINMPYRPLQRGSITIREASLSSIFFYFIGLALAITLGLKFFLVSIVFFIVSVAYSAPPISLMKHGIWGNIILAICTIFVPAIGGSVYAMNSFDVPETFSIATISFTSLFMHISLVKDLKDIEGDKKYGKKTFAVIASKDKTLLTTFAGIIIFFPITTYLFAKYVFNQGLFYILSTITFILLLWVTLQNREGYNQKAEDDRFGKLRLVVLIYVSVILLFSY